jgi:6-phosphogluconate dehydrogenase
LDLKTYNSLSNSNHSLVRPNWDHHPHRSWLVQLAHKILDRSAPEETPTMLEPILPRPIIPSCTSDSSSVS